MFFFSYYSRLIDSYSFLLSFSLIRFIFFFNSLFSSCFSCRNSLISAYFFSLRFLNNTSYISKSLYFYFISKILTLNFYIPLFSFFILFPSSCFFCKSTLFVFFKFDYTISFPLPFELCFAYDSEPSSSSSYSSSSS